jgi:hypothetical protein
VLITFRLSTDYMQCSVLLYYRFYFIIYLRGDVCLSNISLVDSNFRIESHIKENDIQFYDVNQPPFKIYGVFHDSGKFRRLPENIAKSVSS